VAVDRVAAVGDSVMLGAAGALRDAIAQIEIDAAVSRQVAPTIELLRSRRDAGQLAGVDVMVVHVGSNGTFTARQFDQMMEVLSGVRRVVFVTVKVPRAWEGPNNAALAAGAQRYANVVLADWHAAAAGRPELFSNDGIHLRPAGAQLYASLIASRVRAP
jgi:lysophospholipase L1-like esterase